MESINDIIAAHPFTKDLEPRFIQLLTERARLEHFRPDQPLFDEGFEADKFYLVRSGQIAIQVFVPGQGTTTIQTITAGECVGWSWLFPSRHWHCSAVAIEPTDVVTMESGRLRFEMEADHDFGYAIAMRVGKLMMDRLQASLERVLHLYAVPS